MSHSAPAQTRPYIGFVYPAGGQQGTTFAIKLGGQGLDDITALHVNGDGVTARIVEYHKALGPQEIQLLNEQARDLRREKKDGGRSSENAMMTEAPMMADNAMIDVPGAKKNAKTQRTIRNELLAKIDRRVSDYVNRPACAALASVLYAEVTVASNAAPGRRELRVETLKGLSNPLVFYVGQHREYCRTPMKTASFQVLGKEELSLRARPTNEVEVAVELPCTVNGQVASGELNKYRFSARKGQRIVISALGRQLIPYIADAVPGWFQPVLALYDNKGREVAYNDDYRFKPDPTLLFEVPKDGEYIFAIYDSIYRGREDFVYRVTVGELPFLTSIYPLGQQAGTVAQVKAKGWNISGPTVNSPGQEARPGIHSVFTVKDRFLSNPLPFDIDTVPETMEKEPNSQSGPQKVQLPTIINGRIDWVDDWDVYQFQGKAGTIVAAEVTARRLESPLDAIVKVTDSRGKLLALNDDREDLSAGVNTHHAESYLMVRLPTNGTYFVHIGDTSRGGGEEYGYRLRISPPQPDFELRAVPSSISIRSSNNATVTVYAKRKDGYTNTIRLALANPPPGFSAQPASITGTQTTARLTIKANLQSTAEPVTLSIMGTGRLSDRVLTNYAAGAEDRMQAFLWRHLVPSDEFKVQVYDPNYTPPPKRLARVRPPLSEEKRAALTNQVAAAKFNKRQVQGRLRQLKLLFEEGLLTDEFYEEKVDECEAAQ